MAGSSVPVQRRVWCCGTLPDQARSPVALGVGRTDHVGGAELIGTVSISDYPLMAQRVIATSTEVDDPHIQSHIIPTCSIFLQLH